MIRHKVRLTTNNSPRMIVCVCVLKNNISKGYIYKKKTF